MGHTFFTSELSKVIREKILWIRLHRTTYWYPTISSSFIYHVGSYFNMHSIIASGLIAGRKEEGGKNSGRDRQMLFTTAVDPMKKNWIEQDELDLTQPRHAAYKQKWKISQDAVFWVDVGRVQRMGSNSSKQGRMRSVSITPFHQYALRGYCPCVRRKFYILERSHHVLHRRYFLKAIGKKIGIQK